MGQCTTLRFDRTGTESKSESIRIGSAFGREYKRARELSKVGKWGKRRWFVSVVYRRFKYIVSGMRRWDIVR